jgi:hypothetical protein
VRKARSGLHQTSLNSSYSRLVSGSMLLTLAPTGVGVVVYPRVSVSN